MPFKLTSEKFYWSLNFFFFSLQKICREKHPTVFSFRGFHEELSSGKMAESEFVEMYQTLFPKGDAQKFALLTFNSFDKNGDGGVDFKEFICALYITSRGTAK